eukprot:6478344-Amphidinium_carterae.2
MLALPDKASHKLLTLSIRKRSFCKCGCGGWCSMFAIMTYLRWCLAILASGQHPTLDWKGLPCPENSQRDKIKGQPLGYKAMLLHLKGDWAEFVNILGVPPWNDGTHPCLLCCASAAGLYDFQNQNDWVRKTHAMYCNACDMAEVHVLLEDEDKLQLQKICAPSRVAKKGRSGLVLREHYSKLGLRKHDRWLPTEQYPDWAVVFGDAPIVGEAVFWRPMELMTKVRHPLYDQELGVTLDNVVAVDLMHTFSLGIIGYFIAETTWAILEANVAGSQRTVQHERHLDNMQCLAKGLLQWYPMGEKDPHHTCTRVNEFGLGTVGSFQHQTWHGKAGEANTYLRFLCHFLEVLPNKFENGQKYLGAAKCLHGLWHKFQTSPQNIPLRMVKD